MIKFFRHIRQRLLNENKMTKYLAYAIGEIILVVIGILIALQINNWNQFRNDRDKEQMFLHKLKSNLNTDKVAYQGIIKKHNEFGNSIDTIIKMLENDKPVNPEIFNKHVRAVYDMTQFTVTKTAFDNLLGSGSLDIISNDSLAEQILLYYRDVERLDKGIDNVFFVQSMENITPYMLLNFDPRNFNISYKKLKEEAFFYNSILMKRGLIDQQKEYYEKQIYKIGEITESINLELKTQ